MFLNDTLGWAHNEKRNKERTIAKLGIVFGLSIAAAAAAGAAAGLIAYERSGKKTQEGLESVTSTLETLRDASLRKYRKIKKHDTDAEKCAC